MGEHFTTLADKEEKENSSIHTPLISESSTSGMKFIIVWSHSQPCTEGDSVLSGKKNFWPSFSVISNSYPSLVPRPSPKKSGKRVWCSEQHFLSHGVELYFVKNVIIAFLKLVFKFLTPRCIWTTTQSRLRWPQGLLGQLKTGCETSFHYFQFSLKYDCSSHEKNIILKSLQSVISNPDRPSPM